MDQELKDRIEAAIVDARLSVRQCLQEHGLKFADGDAEVILIHAIGDYAYISNTDDE
jgi:hypothetical protein